MVFTRKFSQFVPEPVDEVVGLTDGANAIGPNGGGGDNIAVIDQANAFIPGQWVRIDVATQVYVLALADTPQDAETWWLVIAATPTQFTIQGGVTRVDFSKFTTTVPGLLPFIVGAPQYISGNTPGLMTYDVPAIPGYVNKPLFIADGPTTGWILSARGYVVAVNQGNPNMCNMVTVTQPGNGFVVGDVIYATTTPNVYAKAIASGTFAQSDRVGAVVIAGDTFTYQTEGNAINVIVTDDVDAPINPGVRYWLSPTVAGKVTATQPIASNQYSVPVYVPYAVAGGIITPQRSLLGPVGAPGASPPVFLGILNEADGFANQTILNGNYHSFWIIFNSLTGNPIQVTDGGANSGIGFQIYSAGAWVIGNCSAYMDGVNSTAGVNTATWWGFVRNDTTPNTMLVVPPIVHQPELGFGFCLLNTNTGFANISGEIDFANYNAPGAVGYTSDFSSSQGFAAAPNGLRMIVDGPGAFVPGSGFYLTVFGIPNS